MRVADPLDLASRALRDVAEAEPAVVAASRARVLAAAGATRTRRLRVVRALLPIAAVLALSSAWASMHAGGPRAWSGMHPSDEGRTVEAPSQGRRASVVAAGAASVPPAPAPAASSAWLADGTPPIPVVPVELLARAPTAGAQRAAPPVRSGIASQTTAAAAETGDSRDAQDLALYEAGHRAHFVDRDWGEALRAWDAYLAAEPDGRFVLEARYNRAIALVRLGHTAEARLALAPFARGQYGEYRMREAREILEALGARELPPRSP
jgi:hypothetical protein